MAVTALLAAGGCGAERDAAKESPIDWPARAATVKVGMTRAEVEEILPRWEPPYKPPLGTNAPITPGHYLAIYGGGAGVSGREIYWVSEDWEVTVCYSGSSKEDCRVFAPVKIVKVKESVPPKP